VVYLGRELDTQAPLLVRVVAGQPGYPMRQLLVAQLHAWQAVEHPRLISGLPVIETDDWVAYACPEPDGLALREWRARQADWLACWRTAGQLCEAVAAMHGLGLIHGDLHPENVLLNAGGARLSRMPLFAPLPGCAFTAYHAPEQLRSLPATARSDVYSLGIILYELFLGAHPFVAETEELQLTLQLYSQPQSPRLRWPEIPLAIEAFLLRLLALDPNERPANGAAALEAFSQLKPN